MKHLTAYVNQPYDPIKNLKLGLEYEHLGQTAAAVSFYIRAAEKTLNRKIQYIALVRAALCFEKQGNRDLTVKTLFQRAISTLPTRPEAYFLLGKFYEFRKEYHECYMLTSIGLTFSDITPKTLDEIPEYPGKYGLLFEKAVSGWWVGLNEESREIIFDLHSNYQMNDLFTISVNNNLNNIGYPKNQCLYKQSYFNEFKYKFPGLEKISTNYSEVYQDMFVLTLLNGKTNGTYLEIGSHDPYYKNNTALLEKTFDWHGISLEINEEKVNQFNNERTNKSICIDALTVDYNELLTNANFDQVIDYLQVDCDPPEVSFEVLKHVLSSNFKFKIITFEHDFYKTSTIRDQSRNYLRSQGYTLLINDVSFNYNSSFEDWWILPEYISTKNFSNFPNNQINFVEDIFYEDQLCVNKTIREILEENPDLPTDKNYNYFEYRHSYFDNFYENEFSKYQNKSVNLCEIGVEKGATFFIWNRYFHKDSNLLGIDNNFQVDTKYYEQNFNNVRYIFNNAYDLDLVNKLNNFDIIIDDGPHTLESQIDCLKLYFPKLNDGGVLIIEDVAELTYIDTLKQYIPDQYKNNIEVINLIEKDNRYDSLLFVVRKN